MANTRDFKSLGEFAVNANEVQEPGDRVAGDSYRNTSFSTFQQNQGKQFGVVPVSENVNQQIFNQSEFTNSLDRTGVPEWRFDIEYNIPAIVWADGKLYETIRDGNTNVDPTTEDPENPNWWSELVSGAALALDLSSQVPGAEGAGLVGATYTPFYGAVPKGQTLQTSLADESQRLYKMQNLRVLANFTGEVTFDGIIDIRNSFNFSSVDITDYYLETNSRNTLGYLTINFQNNIPTPYIYMLSITPVFITSQPSTLSKGQIYVGPSFSGVADAFADSIKVGSFRLMNRIDINPLWGIEDAVYRDAWYVNFFAFLVD